MDRKYEFTGETKEAFGHTLRRIRAVRDIERFGVKAGDKGGWIEAEHNLSQEGNAWVCGNAWISGNAWVYGNARVYGNAWVYGNACVYGNAQVFGGKWEKPPLYIQGTAWAFYMASDNKIGIGCQRHGIDYWREHWQDVVRKFGASEEQVREYMLYFNLAAARYGFEGIEEER